MQRVILPEELSQVAAQMEPEVFRHIGEGQIESFESFESFNLLSFDWYDIHSNRVGLSKIMIYTDKSDIIFICSDRETKTMCEKAFEKIRCEGEVSNEQLLCRFFMGLFRGDMEYLDELENSINNAVNTLLSGEMKNALDSIIVSRRELLRLKHYYEQIDTIFDEIVINDNKLLSGKAIKYLSILGARTDRYLTKVCNLQELVSHLQETYQSQLAIQQNELMKFFTVITAIFLPLTLLVGWYGMNFSYMPELHWKYAYPVLIGVSAAVAGGLIWYFKHKKWL
ncbi:MAG: CorA family divalent cation transporter [Oscillospiraceae bacterium]|nr:CorA family divalent cation transporter [Oscillospiraceae bacterium]